MTQARDPEEARRALKRSLRKARLYTYGFLAAALGLAVAGAALVAWLLAAAGRADFVEAWALLATLLLGVAALAAVVKNWRS